MKKSTCIICLEKITGKFAMLAPCTHQCFHLSCIQEWEARSPNNLKCPMCRTTVHVIYHVSPATASKVEQIIQLREQLRQRLEREGQPQQDEEVDLGSSEDAMDETE
jgi:hypothetical protein